MKTGIYNAGPLFTEGEQLIRKKEGVDLRAKINKDLTINNPIDADFNHSGVERTNKIIFDFDYYTMIENSNIAIFDLDAGDPGTLIEYGIYIEKALKRDDIYLIVKVTDFRSRLSIDAGQIPGFALNGFLTGTFNNDKLMSAKPVPQIYLVSSSDDAIETINAIHDVVSNNKQVDPIEFHKEYSKLWYDYQNPKKYKGFSK